MKLKNKILNGLIEGMTHNLDRTDRDAFRISSAGSCVRKIYYQQTKVKETNLTDPRMDLVFRCGDWVHDEVRKLLTGIEGISLALVEKTLTLSVGRGTIKGHCDGVILAGRRKVLFDIKTMSKYGYELLKKGKVSPEYLYQIVCYKQALKEMALCDVTDCWIIGVNRERMELTIHELDWTPDDYQSILEELYFKHADYEEALKKNEPPDPLPTSPSNYLPWNCRYCSFMDKCWIDDQGYGLRVADKYVKVLDKEKE